MHFATCVGEVPERREVCRASDRAPRAPAARASTAARFNEKLRADLLFFDDIIAVGAMDVCSEYSLLILVRTRNLTEVCGAFRNPGFGVFGPPQCIQMDEGGGWKNEVQTELRSERRTKLFVQGVSAHPWTLDRRDGFPPGIYNRLMEDDRVRGKQILADVQWRPSTLISGGGFATYRKVFGSKPVDHFWTGE